MGSMRTVYLVMVFLAMGAAPGSLHADGHHYASVYLDPHYGGRDNGPLIDKRYKSKDLTLGIARAIQQELSNKNIRAYLSREDDVYIPRGDRWFFAKKKGADIYLSVRLARQDVDSVRIYYGKRSPAETKYVKADAEKDAAVSAAVEDRVGESARLAELLLKGLRAGKAAPCSSVHTKKDIIFETADFPAVIIELGASRTAEQHSYITDGAKINMIVQAIAAAIKEFIEVPLN